MKNLIGEIQQARPVACMRGNLRTGLTFDAEVNCSDVQVVIQTGVDDREKAKSIANIVAEEINLAMKEAALEILMKYKLAQA